MWRSPWGGVQWGPVGGPVALAILPAPLPSLSGAAGSASTAGTGLQHGWRRSAAHPPRASVQAPFIKLLKKMPDTIKVKDNLIKEVGASAGGSTHALPVLAPGDVWVVHRRGPIPGWPHAHDRLRAQAIATHPQRAGVRVGGHEGGERAGSLAEVHRAPRNLLYAASARKRQYSASSA